MSEFIDRGIIDGFLHLVARVFTWIGDLIKNLNALPEDIRHPIREKVHEYAGTRKAVTSRRKRFRRAAWQKK